MEKFSFPQNAAFPFLIKKKTFKSYIALLATFSLFWSACQKPRIKDDIQPSKLSTMSDRVTLGIQFSDIMAKLPQTVMYELGDSVKFYTGKYESLKTDSTLAVRIPTTLDGNHYVYAVRSFNNPADLKVYLVQFIPDRGSVPERYTGQQIWLDVQDWHIYGTTYKSNIPTQQLKPIQLAEPGWEEYMINSGYFSINDLGKLNVSDEPSIALDGPGKFGCCRVGGSGNSWFKNFTRAIGSFLGGLFTEGSDNTGGILEWPREWYGSGGGGAGGASAGGGGSSNNWTPNGTIGNGPALAPNGFEGNSGVTPNTNTAAAFLVNFLVNHSQPLTQNEVNWLVFHNAPDAIKMQQYILGPTQGFTLQEKAAAIKAHIALMTSDIDYNNFINNYKQNNNGNWTWWIDANFLAPFGGLSFGQWAINYWIVHPDLNFADFKNQFLGVNEGKDGDYDENYWNSPPLIVHQNLPSWNDFYTAYPKNAQGNFEMPAVDVYNLIGGTPKSMRDATLNDNNPNNDHDFDNACALRVSRALNYSGVTIPNIPNQTFKGSDNKYYFLGARNLYEWMKKTFPLTISNSIILSGSDGGTNGGNYPNLLGGNKGIYLILPVNSSNSCFGASGHAGIYTTPPLTHYYFNATCGVHSITLWKLN